jgi:hypothetical protein
MRIIVPFYVSPFQSVNNLTDFTRFGMDRTKLNVTGGVVNLVICKINGFMAVRQQPPAHAGSSLADSSTLKMEKIRSSETSVHTRSTRHHIPKDGILQPPICT